MKPQIEGTPYPLLRHLTLPVVAVTTSARGRRNGFIVNSAQRASLVPSHPRISVYVSKPNFSHGLVYDAGVFTVHLLRDDQWGVIRALGLRSARDVPDKLDALDWERGVTGCPVLTDCVASFECRVVNGMDAGGATFFLGEVVDTRRGDAGSGGIMTSTHFRAAAPDDVRERYEKGLAVAQGVLEGMSGTVTPGAWPGPSCEP